MNANYEFQGLNIVLNFRRKLVYDFDKIRQFRNEWAYCRMATLDERKKFFSLLPQPDSLVSFEKLGFKYKKADLWKYKETISERLDFSSVTVEKLNYIADLVSLKSYEDVVRFLLIEYFKTVKGKTETVEEIEKRISKKHKTDFMLLKSQLDNILKYM